MLAKTIGFGMYAIGTTFSTPFSFTTTETLSFGPTIEGSFTFSGVVTSGVVTPLTITFSTFAVGSTGIETTCLIGTI